MIIPNYLTDFIPSAIFIAGGIIVTLKYTFLSVFFGFIIGAFVAFSKFKNYKFLNLFLGFYTSLFRGTPLLVQLAIIYYGSPRIGIKIDVFAAGIIAFSLNSGAYLSEIFRSGIENIDKGQFEAARSLGISEKLILKDIILPQVLRNISPALVNELINIVKESAIISMLAENDLMRRAQLVAAEKYIYFLPMITAALYYYLIVSILSLVAHYLEKKFKL